MKLFATLLLTILAWQTTHGQGILCTTTHCFLELGACVLDSRCYEILNCLQGCEGRPDEVQCSYVCGSFDVNPHFRSLVNCMVENGCMPTYSEDGLCLANDDQADQMITDLEQVSGDWWVLKGQNCGQDEVWYGGADWAPCQHGRFVKVDDGSWINNTTFCVGSDSTCISDLIVTIPKLSLVAPGVVRHNYPEGQAPIIPQIEDWKFMAMPDPDWALVIWCGSNPVLKYNGAFVISRHQSLDHLAPEVEVKLREAASNFGLDYDEMCVSNNENCPE